MAQRPAETRVAGSAAILPARFWLPLAIAAVVSVATLVVAELAYRSFTEARAEVGQGFTLRAKLLQLEKTVVEAETSQRGYLLTRKSIYLEPFQRSAEAIRPLQREILDLTYMDKEVRDRLGELSSLIAVKLAEMERTISMANAEEFERALALIEGDEGRQTMERIRRSFAEINRVVVHRMEAQNARWSDSMDANRSAVQTVVGINVMLIAMLALVLIRDQRRLRAAAQAQASQAERLEAEVARRTAQLSSLSDFLQANTEREKAALSRELHDELGGILTPAKMDLAWLQGRLSADPEYGERLARVAALLDQGIDLKRRIIESLRPSLLDHLGLAAALQWYVEETCKAAGLEHRLDVSPELERLPSDLEIALYRLVQESVNNTVKHARATRVDLSVQRTAAGLRVTIADDGAGIADLESALKQSHGLAGMRHRVTSVRGTFQVRSRAGHGTIVEAFVPLPAGAA